MWIRTDENVLLNADKVTYFEIQPIYQHLIDKRIEAGIKIMAITENENINVITFLYYEIEPEKAKKEIDEVFNYIAESIDEDIFKLIEMEQWK